MLFAVGALEQAAAQTLKEVLFGASSRSGLALVERPCAAALAGFVEPENEDLTPHCPAGRVMVGLAVGLASMVLPVYLGEISPPAFRGRIVGSLVVLITGGQVVAYCITAALMHVNQSWRWSFGAGAVPAVAQLVLSFSVPESPRWLVRQGRIVAARRSLSLLSPHAAPASIQRRLDAIQAEASDLRDGGSSTATKGNWRSRMCGAVRGCSWDELRQGRLGALLHDRASRRALAVAIGLQWFQQSTGFNNLMYYSGKILAQTHLSQPAAFAIFIAVSNFVATLVALRLIDHVGRRYLLLRTFVGMSIGMALLAFAFVFISADVGNVDGLVAPSASPWAFVALAAMVGFCASYALGVGNVAWVVQSEVRCVPLSHPLLRVSLVVLPRAAALTRLPPVPGLQSGPARRRQRARDRRQLERQPPRLVDLLVHLERSVPSHSRAAARHRTGRQSNSDRTLTLLLPQLSRPQVPSPSSRSSRPAGGPSRTCSSPVRPPCPSLASSLPFSLPH